MKDIVDGFDQVELLKAYSKTAPSPASLSR